MKTRSIAILLFFLLQVVTITGLLLFKIQEDNNLLHERQEDLEHQFKASTLAYQRLAEFFFAQLLDTPEVIGLIALTRKADPKENLQIRQNLYRRALPTYTHLRAAGFRQLHFHLADGTSFLRLHLPEEFGDSLLQARPSIARMIAEKRALQGYEIGRHRQAYRYIFPLFDGDDFVGSVEISLPLSTLLANLMDTFPNQVRFVVHQQVAAAHMTEESLLVHFRPSFLGPNFLVEQEDRPINSPPGTDPEYTFSIEDSLFTKATNTIQRHADTLTTLASLPIKSNGRTMLITLLPIHNIAGRQAGFLIFFGQFPYLDIVRQRYIVGWFAVTALSSLLLLHHNRYTLKIEESHAELDQIFNTAADGIRVLDTDGTIIRANTTFADMVGLPMDSIIGQPCHTILGGENCATELCPKRQIQDNKQKVLEEAEKILPDGKRITCMVVASPFFDSQGKRIGIIEDFRDISLKKQVEQRLRDMAITDELTGLNNRRGFMHLGTQQLQCINRSNNEAFLLFADLDNMKTINDTLGHEAGDLALQTTAKILRATVREADLIGRMGGDEFAVLFSVNPQEASEKRILERLNRELEKINAALVPEQQISISFGLVRATAEIPLETLLNLADKKMYAVKQQRKAQKNGV